MTYNRVEVAISAYLFEEAHMAGVEPVVAAGDNDFSCSRCALEWERQSGKPFSSEGFSTRNRMAVLFAEFLALRIGRVSKSAQMSRTEILR